VAGADGARLRRARWIPEQHLPSTAASLTFKQYKGSIFYNFLYILYFSYIYYDTDLIYSLFYCVDF
jgi:hypothetical protein